MSSIIRLAGVLVMAVAMSGCATSNNPQDPLEGFNRAMFSFNDALDEAALKPAANAYKSTLPSFVQTGIGNFFGNIGDVWNAVNNFLQGKVSDGASDVIRVAVNTTIGVYGLFDVGSQAGLAKHNEDFGQTLAVWGVKSGPYVVLPFMGSSTLRDALAAPVDMRADLWRYQDPVKVRNVGFVVRTVDQRAAVLDASNLIEDAALDKYEFVRDAYLQRRANIINDGESAKPKSDDKSSSNQEPVPPDTARQPIVTPTASVEPLLESVVKLSNPVNDDMKLVFQLPPIQENAPAPENIQVSAMPMSSDSTIR